MGTVHGVTGLEGDDLVPTVLLNHRANFRRGAEGLGEVLGEVGVVEHLNRSGDKALAYGKESAGTGMIHVGRAVDLLGHELHLLVGGFLDGLHVLDGQDRVPFHVGIKDGNAFGVFDGRGVFDDVDDGYRPEQAGGGLHVVGHGERVFEVHETGEGIEISAAHHDRIRSRLGADEQLGQPFGFLQQFGALRVVRDVKWIQRVRTVRLNHKLSLSSGPGDPRRKSLSFRPGR